MLSYFSALFWRYMNGRRGWAYPRTGPSLSGQPACFGAETIHITCMQGWREAELQSLRECDVERRGISRPVVNETWMG